MLTRIMKPVNSFICSLIVIIYACGPKSQRESPSGYLKYFSQDGHARIVETKALKYEVQLLPPECMALRACFAGGHLDESAYRNRIHQIEDNIYFAIRLYHKTEETVMDKATLLRYYESSAKSNASITVNQSQVIQAEYVNYEDNYGLTPYNTLLFCFRCPHALNSRKLVFSYADDVYANEVKVTYSYQDFKEYPSLAL